jgi:hypothetical protein
MSAPHVRTAGTSPRALQSRLDATACARYDTLRFEPGNRQHAARTLYAVSGHARLLPFNAYRDVLTNACVEKRPEPA